jgi:arylsulfatase A-like enzyme
MSNKPNIIFIITDQQRFDTIRELGFPYMDTPHLDRMVREGTSFMNTFISAPSCAPSRASLFTGLFPHTTGIYKNDDAWSHSWVESLADAGYHCVNVGKMHSSPYETPMGFHERYVVENKDRQNVRLPFFFDEWDKALRARNLIKPGRRTYCHRSDYKERMGAFDWELSEDMHPDMFVGDVAKWWIEERPKVNKPVFLQIGFPGPHPPFDPIPRYAEPYMKKDLPLPNVTEDILSGQPEALVKLRRNRMEADYDSVIHLENPSRDQLHRLRAYYLANVTMIDEKIGEILNSLENKGYLENAVVIFTSDHGESLGDHGHSQKWTMYDEVTRVPMIVWSPGRFQSGRKIDSLTQLMDLGPTVLELAGLQVPDWMEARSLLPFLKGEAQEERSYVFSEHSRDALLQETEFIIMIRSRDWKLVYFIDDANGQLFNLNNDPSESRNLWDDPNYDEKKQELIKAILDWRIRSALKTQNWDRERQRIT